MDTIGISFQNLWNFGYLWLAFIASVDLCSAQNSDLFVALPKQQVLGIQLTRDLNLKGISVPLGQPDAGIVIHCDKVRVVSKQIGMMKIGLIPALEVSGMSWEIRGQIPASAWCGMVKAFFQSEPLLGQSSFEGFAMVFGAAKNFRLEATAARIDAERNVLLIEKPTLEIGGQQFSFHRAELLLEGDCAGKLVIASSKSRRVEVVLPLEILPLTLHYNHQ